MIAKSFVILLLFVVLASGVALAAVTAPDVLVKEVTDQVLSTLRQDKGIHQGNRQRTSSLIETQVAPHFDFTRMTSLAVGRAWWQADAAQRTALVKQFRTLLVLTYAAALSSYQDQTVTFKPSARASETGEVTVHSQINQPGAQPVALDYSLSNTSEGWKVFDVMIANVSLVTNYRSSFAQELEKGGIDRLIRSLQEKNRHLDAEAHPSA
jgi:phospholipid transport system substrate-binding protein